MKLWNKRSSSNRKTKVPRHERKAEVTSCRFSLRSERKAVRPEHQVMPGQPDPCDNTTTCAASAKTYASTSQKKACANKATCGAQSYSVSHPTPRRRSVPHVFSSWSKRTKISIRAVAIALLLVGGLPALSLAVGAHQGGTSQAPGTSVASTAKPNSAAASTAAGATQSGSDAKDAASAAPATASSATTSAPPQAGDASSSASATNVSAAEASSTDSSHKQDASSGANTTETDTTAGKATPQASINTQGNSEAQDAASGGVNTATSDGAALKNNILAALPPGATPTATNRDLGDPAGFAWKFRDVSPTECAIVGYSVNGAPGDVPSASTTVTSGVVHVPATNPANGKAVVGFVGGTSSAFSRIAVPIDFTGAVNLKSIGTNTPGGDSYYPFQESKLTGVVDLSKCVKLTNIAQQSFQNSKGITGLKLPSSLTTIGAFAFSGCTSLTGDLALPDSLSNLSGNLSGTSGGSQFFDCDITSLGLGKNTHLTTIPASCFSGNKHLAKIYDPSFPSAPNNVIPAKITDLGSGVFTSCSLPSITFAGPIGVGQYCFQANKITNNPINTSTTFTSLGAFAFADNEISGVVDFSKARGNLAADGIVSGNSGITDIVASPSWILIPNYFASGLTALQSFSLPANNKVETIGTSAFQGDTALTTVNLNNAPLKDGNGKAVGDNAFQGCTSLKTVSTGNGLFTGLTKSTLTIGNSAFQGDTVLDYINVPLATVTSAQVEIVIGNKAFMDTNLGAFPDPDNPSQILGTLPLNRHDIVSIGNSAFENAGLTGILLPDTVKKIGSRAFANNHIDHLTLPNNAALDGVGAVGADVLAGQTLPDRTAYWIKDKMSSTGGFLKVKELGQTIGVPLSQMKTLTVTTPSGQKGPFNNWQDPKAQGASFTLSDLQAATAATVGMNIYRKGNPNPLSTGSVTVGHLQEGVSVNFYIYDHNNPTQLDVSFTQMVPPGQKPQEVLFGVPNFGWEKDGFHTGSGAFDVNSNPYGWKTGSDYTGQGVDPAQVVVNLDNTYNFSNRWVSNKYSVHFDNNWNYMVSQDKNLGMQKPNTTDPKDFVPNPDYVKGSMADQSNFAYTEYTKVNDNAFTMGGYDFDGWATSPNLDPASRIDGKNYVKPGGTLVDPDPAPTDGATITLYAQWKVADLGSDAHIATSIVIPRNISMDRESGFLWSKNPKPTGSDSNAYTVSIQPLGDALIPGQLWPDNTDYNVFVIPQSVADPSASAGGSSASGNLVELKPFNDSSPSELQPISVLTSDKQTVYDPTFQGGKPTVPLMTLRPIQIGSLPVVPSGTFYLKSDNNALSFKPNTMYSGSMYFYFEQEQVTGS